MDIAREKQNPFMKTEDMSGCRPIHVRMYIAVAWSLVSTVVPVMNGHPRGKAKVPARRRDRWAAPNVIHLERLHPSPPAIFVLNTKSCIVIIIIMYAIVIEPKTNAS